jgi:hypothetical protein
MDGARMIHSACYPSSSSDTVMKNDLVMCCCATHSLYVLMSLLLTVLGRHSSPWHWRQPRLRSATYRTVRIHSSHSTVRSGPRAAGAMLTS